MLMSLCGNSGGSAICFPVSEIVCSKPLSLYFCSIDGDEHFSWNSLQTFADSSFHYLHLIKLWCTHWNSLHLHMVFPWVHRLLQLQSLPWPASSPCPLCPVGQPVQAETPSAPSRGSRGSLWSHSSPAVKSCKCAFHRSSRSWWTAGHNALLRQWYIYAGFSFCWMYYYLHPRAVHHKTCSANSELPS